MTHQLLCFIVPSGWPRVPQGPCSFGCPVRGDWPGSVQHLAACQKALPSASAPRKKRTPKLDSFKTASYVKIKKGIKRHDHSIRRIVGCSFGKKRVTKKKKRHKHFDFGNSFDFVPICRPPSLRAFSWLAALLSEDPNAPTGALSAEGTQFRSRWNIPGKLNEMGPLNTKMQETMIK